MLRNLAVGVFMMAGLALTGCAGPNGEAPTATAAASTPEPSFEPVPTRTPDTELAVGDCLDRDRALISCDEEHFFEVHLVLTLSDPPGAPFPDGIELISRVDEADQEAMVAYFGGTPEVSFGSGGPGLTEDAWNDGKRLIVRSFYLINESGEPLPVTGSLRGTFG